MSQVSDEYASALFDVLESKQEKTEALSFLSAIAKTLNENKEFDEGLRSKTFPVDNIKSIFNTFADETACSAKLKNFLNVLIDNQRMSFVSDIHVSLQKAMDSENGVVRGVVKSSHPVSSTKREELENRLSSNIGQKVILNYIEDKSVVAGLKVELESHTLDDTVETHLKKIKENVNRSTN